MVGLPASLVCSRDLRGVKERLLHVSAADRDKLRFLLKIELFGISVMLAYQPIPDVSVVCFESSRAE